MRSLGIVQLTVYSYSLYLYMRNIKIHFTYELIIEVEACRECYYFCFGRVVTKAEVNDVFRLQETSNCIM